MNPNTTCSHCHVDVHGSLSHCPLCGRFLHKVDPIQHQQLYPNPNYKIIERRNRKLIETILAFPLLTTLFITLLIDLVLIRNNFGTSFLVTVIVFYAWILLYRTLLSKNSFSEKVLWQVGGLSGLLFLIGFVTESTFNTWPLNVVIPILLTTANVLMLIVASIQRKTDIMLLHMFLLAWLTMIPFALFLLGIHSVQIPSFIAFLSGWVNLLALLTYLRKKFWAFIQRWFHI